MLAYSSFLCCTVRFQRDYYRYRLPCKLALANLPDFVPDNSDQAEKCGAEHQQTRCLRRGAWVTSGGAENGERFGGNGTHKLLIGLRGTPLRLAVEASILVPSKVRSAGNGAMPQRNPIASIRQSWPSCPVCGLLAVVVSPEVSVAVGFVRKLYGSIKIDRTAAVLAGTDKHLCAWIMIGDADHGPDGQARYRGIATRDGKRVTDGIGMIKSRFLIDPADGTIFIDGLGAGHGSQAQD